jgi:DNA-binding NarL/FixJ family response regulator
MPPTILIVEDHDALRASLRHWLKAVFVGCRWLEAASGEEAVAVAGAEFPDLVLMDIGLPDMNGIQATKQIKGVAPQARVIIVTVHEAPEYRFDAVAAGASGYVVKRDVTKDLIPLMQRLLCTTGEP